MAKTECNRDLALIGAGYWGKNLARNFNQLGALHTICDQSEDLLNNFKTEEYSEVNLTHSLESVLNDPRIAKVGIAVPAALHYEVALKALKAGKDVFVEKPLCLDVNHGEQLVEEASMRSRILMVGHLLQYHPCIIKLQELVQNGKLGKLYYLTSNRLNLGKIRREENALWSFAPHDISIILSLVGYKEPEEIRCIGEAYINHQVADTTLTTMRFESNIRAHVYVSWLNPFKEQKLTVVGSQGMAVFDDSKPWNEKLTLHQDYLSWDQGQNPTPVKKPGMTIEVEEQEPLKRECEHFLRSCETRLAPKTDGNEGLLSLRVLTAAQRSLETGGKSTTLEVFTDPGKSECDSSHSFAHETAIVDEGATIGAGTKIWHFSHIFNGALIGERCVLGQNTMVAGGAIIGNNVKIQNNVSVYSGVSVEDDVFLGPSCVLTNVSNPRSQVNRQSIYEKTLIRRGATVGANATIIPGITLGRYCFISAGAVVTRDVPDYAMMKGVPAKRDAWMSRHGHLLVPGDDGELVCPESGLKYENREGELRCLDIEEEAPLPENKNVGKSSYRNFKL